GVNATRWAPSSVPVSSRSSLSSRTVLPGCIVMVQHTTALTRLNPCLAKANRQDITVLPVGSEAGYAVSSERAGPVLGPAFHHDFRLGVKLHAVPALRVQVAEEAVAPAAEREECHRGGHPSVDADVAGPDRVPERPGVGTGGGEDACLVAEAAVVHHFDGFVDRVRMHQ